MFYHEFISYLEKDDKFGAICFVLDLLEKKELSIMELYNQFLIPCLNEMTCPKNSDCIWKEHFRSSVVRTLIECCYLKVSELGKESRFSEKKVLVFCPEEEYHELGARMMADFFTYCGQKTFYLGGNTPKDALIEALRHLDPEIIALGVSNYFNSIAAKKTIAMIREILGDQVEIFVGGAAFKEDQDLAKAIGADLCINTLAELEVVLERWEDNETGI